MSLWSAGGAAIDRIFKEDDDPIFTGAGLTAEPVKAIRAEYPAPEFSGPGQSLLTIVYEIEMAALPARPTNGNTFSHMGRKWSVANVAAKHAIGKWELTVTDAGAATP